MARPISYRTYRDRVFNTMLTECFVKLHAIVNGLDESCCGQNMEHDVECPKNRAQMANAMAREFFKEEMNLADCTMSQTKKNLSEAVTFVKDCVALCEDIAEEKMQAAMDQKLDLTDDDTGEEVSEEDKSELEKLFDAKSPAATADVVAKASVDAMLEEKEKSEEIKDAIDLAKAAGDTKSLEETVARMERRGPTSLMNAIVTFVSEAAVRDVNQNIGNNAQLQIGKILEENAEEIRARSMMMYSLYETMNAFGFKRYTEKDIRDAAWNIYSGK